MKSITITSYENGTSHISYHDVQNNVIVKSDFIEHASPEVFRLAQVAQRKLAGIKLGYTIHQVMRENAELETENQVLKLENKQIRENMRLAIAALDAAIRRNQNANR